MAHEKSDLWADWLLHYRHGGDAKIEQRIRKEVLGYADRVLDGARLGAGMTLADVGTGDGVVALRAIERLGPSLKVLMTDISAPLLDHAQALAAGRGVLGQCTFMQGSAESLAGVAQDSVDAVTARAVLAYVADKPAAFREFHRVLRPGGYMSIAEPIMQDDAIEVCALRKLIDTNPATSADPFFPMLLRWRSMLYPDTEEKMRQLPITNFGERDLVRHALEAGFTEVHMEFHVDVKGVDRRPPWDVYLELSPHPLAPTLNEVLSEHFTPEERAFFEERLRAVYDQGVRFGVERIAWLTARKPVAAA